MSLGARVVAVHLYHRAAGRSVAERVSRARENNPGDPPAFSLMSVRDLKLCKFFNGLHVASARQAGQIGLRPYLIVVVWVKAKAKAAGT